MPLQELLKILMSKAEKSSGAAARVTTVFLGKVA
jgi:hypothetical protein